MTKRRSRSSRVSHRESVNGVSATNAVLGVWLFLSAFLWTQSPGEKTNAWLVGLVIAIVGVVGKTAPVVRWVNTLAALWLFASTVWLYRATGPAAWNNIIAAILVFMLSLLPVEGRSRH